MSLRRVLLPAALLIASLALVAEAVAKKDKGGGRGHGAHGGPGVIALPAGWQPEGIAADERGRLYVGSLATGSILRADPRTGHTDVLAPRTGRAVTGVKVARGLIFAAGQRSGHAYVIDARTGTDVADLTLTPNASFVNDVTLTRGAAWFTDSAQPQLYAVARDRHGKPTGAVRTVPLSGDLVYDADPATVDLNGIVATKRGRALIAVQTRTGQLFRIDPATGVAKLIALQGGDVANGDGLLLHGKRTLLVVQNRLNRIAVVRLDRDLSGGRIVKTITDPDFDVPTTLAKARGSLFAVNARFGTPPEPTTAYSIVRVGP